MTSLIVDFVKIFEVVSYSMLVFIGFVLILDWKKNKRDTLFFWGNGLFLWGIVGLLDVYLKFVNYLDSHLIIGAIFLLKDIVFIFFLIAGTLILFMDKLKVRIIVFIYFMAALYFNVKFVLLDENVLYASTFNSFFFQLPALIVMSYFFYDYYRKMDLIEIQSIAVYVIILTISSYLYSILLQIELSEFMFTYFIQIIIAVATIGFSYKLYNFLYKSKALKSAGASLLKNAYSKKILEIVKKYNSFHPMLVLEKIDKMCSESPKETYIERKRLVTKIYDKYFPIFLNSDEKERIKAQLMGYIETVHIKTKNAEPVPEE